MRECYGHRFYHNGNMYDCHEFRSSLIFEGESVYEVIRVVKGIPLFSEDHLQRLHRTLDIKKGEIQVSDREIMDAVNRIIRENHITEGNIKVIFNFEKDRPGVSHFLVYQVTHHYPSQEQYEKGVKCILYQAERPCPTAKIIHHNLRLTLYNKLIETGTYEALLVNRQGIITEGSRSNVFFIRDNILYTAPDHLVLQGISRKYVISICRDQCIPLKKEAISVTGLSGIEAAFLTGTSIKVLPVSHINGHSFSTSHPLLLTLMKEYDKTMDEYIRNKDRFPKRSLRDTDES